MASSQVAAPPTSADTEAQIKEVKEAALEPPASSNEVSLNTNRLSSLLIACFIN